MAHFCHICKCSKSNESFSGGGHRDHICKNCRRLPIEKRHSIENKDEICNFLSQSHISAKNMVRLKTLISSPNAEVAELAMIVFEVAEIRPYKKRRLKELAHKRRDLLLKLESTGLILAHYVH